MSTLNGPLRVGIGGPVGSGKTTLTAALCRAFRERYDICAITNDIYTKEDAEILMRLQALPLDQDHGRRAGRDAAYSDPRRLFDQPTGDRDNAAEVSEARSHLARIRRRQSRGDVLPELADLTIYVIDVAQGEKIPRKGGPGITRSDLLVINKTDLAPYVGASLEVMERDAKRMRGDKPFVMASIGKGAGVDDVVRFIERAGGLYPATP